MELGALAPAIEAAERALEIYTRAHGRDHHDTARTRSNLGLLLVRNKRTDEGLAALREADAIYERLYGDGDVRRAEPLHALGTALVELGRAEEAEPPLRRAVAIASAALGPEHPRTRELQASLDEALRVRPTP